MKRIGLLLLVCAALAAIPLAAQAPPAPDQVIEIDTQAKARPFPHYWERIFGSGRAILALREDYRRDLRTVKAATDMQYVRFHDILDDDVGVYGEDAQGNPVYNFSYVDQIYDGLLANGVRPFVELSFMPRKLSVDPPTLHPFWYHPIVSAPRDYDRWGDLVHQFTKHLVERYGIDEVSQWYFEVWNEPNLDFWDGKPKQATYFELYDQAARAIKKVSPRLRVGGPATAQAAWVPDFIRHCVENNVPVDFVSTHVYANDKMEDVFGTEGKSDRRTMVCQAVKKVHDQVKASARPDLPIEWSEFNASYMNEPDVTDAVYMGPWMAETIRQCDGLVDNLAYWSFSDVFDEQGVVKEPFYGGFGLIAEGGIPKPSFNAFELLHRLGDQRIDVDADALVTRRADGTLAIALWNYDPPGNPGPAKTVTLRLKGLRGKHRVTIQRAYEGDGAVAAAYEKMGKPRYPTAQQYEALRAAAALPPAETKKLKGDEITLALPPYGLALVEIR
jgi:xylan 1,4-beta-xylosidase